jgi:hypothetical protein
VPPQVHWRAQLEFWRHTWESANRDAVRAKVWARVDEIADIVRSRADRRLEATLYEAYESGFLIVFKVIWHDPSDRSKDQVFVTNIW